MAAISPDGRLIAIERCLTEDFTEGSYGESYYCTQSELLLWQMDDVQNGNMEPAARVPLNTTRSSLVFSPQTDDNGNRLLAVGGLVSKEGEDPRQAEASTSLYQVTPDADISYIQTMDDEYRSAFRSDGNVLYLRNLETRDYRAWGVPGLANR